MNRFFNTLRSVQNDNVPFTMRYHQKNLIISDEAYIFNSNE